MTTTTPRATRVDARAKVTGAALYAGDVVVPGLCHAALVRSPLPHARIVSIHKDAAESMGGVVGVFTAEDLNTSLYGRRVRDVPVLPADKVRYIGERVAVVVAETREQAEAAVLHVEVDYEELPAAVDVEAALADKAPLVHERPWEYENAVVPEGHPSKNLQSDVIHGDESAALDLLARSDHVVDMHFTTPSGHAGYIEPQVSLVDAKQDGTVHVWVSDKGPYRMRRELASCLDIDVERITAHPVAIGGDFGGKGSYAEVPLCAALSIKVGRPIRLALRYSEDLVSTNPRHSTSMRVRIGCNSEGDLQAIWFDAIADGGAYAGYKPRQDVDLHGVADAGSPYRFHAAYNRGRIVYTNSLPRGHMRTPGSPQTVFAVESALDELAKETGLSPLEFRMRNLLRTGEANIHGVVWAEARSVEVLEAASTALNSVPPASAGWLEGTGFAVYDRGTTNRIRTSIALEELADGSFVAEVPVPETGTGSHTVAARALAKALGVPPEKVAVVHVPSSDLPFDRGAGGSRVSVGLIDAIYAAAESWTNRETNKRVVVDVDQTLETRVTSFCVQAARVAVHPETLAIKVMTIVSAVDVAEIINPLAHQMQLDGGTAMGYGFAFLEDLQVEDGQVWAGNLGEFKIPSIRDVPELRTTLVEGGIGVGSLGIKAVGELTNVPTAAAIGNAIADAVGVRLTGVPMTAEALWRVTRGLPAGAERGEA